MFSAAEYRKFAKECTEHARVSKSEDMRKHFIEMAKAWMLAATRSEKWAHRAAARAIIRS